MIARFSAGAVASEWVDGAFVRAIPDGDAPVLVAVTQAAPDAIDISFGKTASDLAPLVASVHAMLGLAADVTPFAHAARGIPWLNALASRMQGVRPASFPTLWEAAVNAVVYQSVSMFAAAAVYERFITAFGTRVRYRERVIEVFPAADRVVNASEAELKAIGVSTSKARTLRALCETFGAGAWSEAAFAGRSTADVCAAMCRVRGIGPWSAAVIALRGLGRLDVFPLRDSGVARTVTALSGGDAAACADALAALGPWRGMLYHALLLARVDARTNQRRSDGPTTERAISGAVRSIGVVCASTEEPGGIAQVARAAGPPPRR